VACHPAYRTKIKATKAWAIKAYAHLGRIWSKSMLVVHLISTAASDPQNNKTGTAQRVSPNPSSFSFSPPLSPPERASEVAGASTDRRSGTVAHLLTSGRRSLEDEHAVVEQLRCDALSREPEPVNPRVGAGEPRVPFPDFDEVRSGDGRPR
jgi:hypothetical protein